MLERYHSTIQQLPTQDLSQIAQYFNLKSPASQDTFDFVNELEARYLCQADIVLACLRLGLISSAEALVGRPIRRCPTSYLPPIWASGAELSDYLEGWIDRHPLPVPPEPRVAWVDPNPSHDCVRGGRSLTTPSYYRYKTVKIGLTISQLLTRGVQRHDLRNWTRWGWVRLA